MKSKSVSSVEFVDYKPIFMHWNIFPFLLIHPVMISWYFLENSNFAMMGVIFGVGLNLILSLLPLWSRSVKRSFRYSKGDVKFAKYVSVEAKEHKGQGDICPIQNQDGERFFEFQKRKYIISESGGISKVNFPVKKTVKEYKASRGLDDAQVKENIKKFGENTMNIPIPTFLDLLQEQAAAPFFIFQVFCVFLWSLDENVFYSLFTLIMLVAFESMIAGQRFRNIKMIRQFVKDAKQVAVYRNKKWVPILSSQLLPGDLVSLEKQKEGDATPCDFLIIDGSVVVNESLLTGEATPQMKESVMTLPEDTIVDMKIHKRNIVFGGTRILHSESGDRLKAPNGGCTALVLKTGFETGQGKLIRTILFATERVTANNREALLFILILLMFALVASGYVLYHGLIDQKRSLFKLILNCILIVTSVVPPELPMELSLAVNNSLMALQQLGIFCTEPFRIPLGGKVEFACFDKTGTLCSDKMMLKEIHAEDKKMAKMVLAGCHSLINIEAQTVGDPMELAGLLASDHTMGKDYCMINSNTKRRFKIVKRFPFSSDLKRMTTIVSTDREYLALTKGAPEVIRSLLKEVPSNYMDYNKMMKEGSRVIALAWKVVIGDGMDRKEIESELSFGGFATFKSDIKEDTLSTIENLLNSSHKVVMITGDNVLTGAHVAKELNFIDKPVLILTKTSDTMCKWISVEDEEYSLDQTEKLLDTFCLCVSGDALDIQLTQDPNWLRTWIREIRIFARVSPDQKELVLTTFKKLGVSALMCGDGTNDVGALKQADIGVALLDGTVEAQLEKLQNQKVDPKKKPSLSDHMDDASVVKMGDASIASPFTSRKSTILSTAHVIRQGRCTLVTTIQMYKILAINSLISAYSLSVLYFEGMKFGDYQMVISGLFIAAAFLFISRSKPLDILSKKRPETSIFAFSVLASILSQFVVNIAVLIYLTREVKALFPPIFEPDADFSATPFNTVVFLVTTIQTLCTFINNYEGHPFMQSMTENRGLFITLSGLSGLLLVLSLEISTPLNTLFQLASLGDFKTRFIQIMLLNVSVNMGIQKIIQFIKN